MKLMCQKIKAVFVVRRIGKPQCTLSTNYSFLCIIAVLFWGYFACNETYYYCHWDCTMFVQKEMRAD